MTDKIKIILQKQFSRIIWNAEIRNLTLSEYLDENTEDTLIWELCTDIAISRGFNLLELQTK